MEFDGPGRFGWPFGGIVRFLVDGLVSLFVLLVVIALLFILVRYLLVATKAAQIYVAKNSPPPTPPVAVNPSPAPSAPAPAAAPPATPAVVTNPPARRRTPKTDG